MTKFKFIIAATLTICFFSMGSPVSAYDWYVGFEAGPCVPTENFDEVMDDEMTYSLSIDYIPSNHIGVRVAYYHHEFQFDSDAISSDALEIDSLGVWAVMDYQMEKYFRFYGLIGPTFFYSSHDDALFWGEDSKDIGWSGGGGFEFSPVPGWGFRFQALYNSAELGDGEPRASWVNTTAGMSFRF